MVGSAIAIQAILAVGKGFIKPQVDPGQEIPPEKSADNSLVKLCNIAFRVDMPQKFWQHFLTDLPPVENAFP